MALRLTHASRIEALSFSSVVPASMDNQDTRVFSVLEGIHDVGHLPVRNEPGSRERVQGYGPVTKDERRHPATLSDNPPLNHALQ